FTAAPLSGRRASGRWGNAFESSMPSVPLSFRTPAMWGSGYPEGGLEKLPEGWSPAGHGAHTEGVMQRALSSALSLASRAAEAPPRSAPPDGRPRRWRVAMGDP